MPHVEIMKFCQNQWSLMDSEALSPLGQISKSHDNVRFCSGDRRERDVHHRAGVWRGVLQRGSQHHVDPGDRGGRAGVIRQSTKYGQFIRLLNED